MILIVHIEVGVHSHAVSRFGCLAGFGDRNHRVRRHDRGCHCVELRATLGIRDHIVKPLLLKDLLSVQQGLALLILDFLRK